jgi:hypothetical protein
MPHSLATGSPMLRNQPCPFCGGDGEVSRVVDDVELTFQCPCSGGSEEAVRWLLGWDRQLPPDEAWVI